MTDLLTKITSGDIKHALLRHFAPPAHTVFFEVASETGFKVSRHIDAVAFGIWPSTGQEVVGIEIKVSRGDWQRELADPAKAQELMRFCDRWYLACPDGLVKPDELPKTWGMLVLKDGSLRKKVVAPKLEPQPLTYGFLMAVLRQAKSVDPELVGKMVESQVAEREKQIEKRIENGVSQRVRDNSSRMEAAVKLRDKIKELTGSDQVDWNFDPEAFAATYRFLKASGISQLKGWGGALPSALNSLESASKQLRQLLDDPLIADARPVEPTSPPNPL